MNKGWYAGLLLASALISGCADAQQTAAPAGQQEAQQTDTGDTVQADKALITALVEDFGKQLQLVSLLAPEESVNESIEEHYADYVSPSLLEAWRNNPQHAPGRTTSSPWPDRIEVQSVEQTAGTYRVTGTVIEITNPDQQIAAKRNMILEVRKIDGEWRIDAVESGEYASSATESVVYENSEFGFRFDLPAGWNGYTIVNDTWEGLSLDPSNDGDAAAEGPIISIRHPQWTAEHPRQDIPIMVLTLDDWAKLEQEEFHIGAAPVGPKPLGLNGEYVFALPARYNFAFLEGYEEVEEILNANPLKTEL